MADDPTNPDFSGMTSENDSPPDLGIASGDMKGLSDLVNSMASARAPAMAPQQQAPQVPRPGLPNIVQFIGGLINPSSPRFNPAGSATGSRAPVFENFIANTLYALGQGLAGEGHGPGAAMRGAGIAATAPYQRDVQNFQLQNQANQQTAQTQQVQAQTGLVGAQTQEAQLQAQMLKRRMGMMDSANPDDAIKGLGVLSTDEQAQVSAARTESNMKGDFSPLLQVVEKISNQRAISGRAGPSGVVEDADSKTGFSKVVYDKTGKNIVQVQKDYVAPGLIGKSTSSQRLIQDKDGNWQAVTVTSTSAPNVPKKGGGKVPIKGGGTPAGGGNQPGALPGSLRTPGGGPTARPVMAAGGGVLQGKEASDMGVAFDPQANERIWTSRSDANQKGLTGFTPAGRNPAQAQEQYRQLNVRLGDVEQKIQAYADSMKSDLGLEDRTTMAAALAATEHQLVTPGMLAKLPGPEGGAAILNEVAKGVNLNELSKPAYQRLQAYVNAREAMNGYTRVLAGSGQSSDTSLHLNLAVLPHPLTDAAQAPEAFNQFRQNLDIVEQGVPRIQGVKTPKEWRGQSGGKTNTPSGKWNALTGRYE